MSSPERPSRQRRPAVGLMLALTFGTGVVDAVGFLGLDRVFTGNMTGNVVILGMGVAGADDLPVIGPTAALLGFMAGALVAGRVLRTSTSGWTARTSALVGAVAVLMAGVAVVTVFVDDDASQSLIVGCSTALAIAMGVQAAAARAVGVKDVTTVVVTSTITGLAADSRLGTRQGGSQGRRVAAVALLLLGALVGALVLSWNLTTGVALAAAMSGGVALVGEIGRRRAGD